MSKDDILRIARDSDSAAFALLVVYSIFIVVSPCLALGFGGVVLWVLLLLRWMKGGLCI